MNIDNKLLAAVSYISILFLLPLLVAKDDNFARFHANQGLVLFLVSVLGTTLLGMIPLVGWLLLIPFGIFNFICFILGILHALQGEYKEIPIIGNITIIK